MRHHLRQGGRASPKHCPTQTHSLSLSQLRKLKPTGAIFSPFSYTRTRLPMAQTQRLTEPRLQKATANMKREKQTHKNPPLCTPQRCRGGKGDEAHGEASQSLPFSASLLFLLSVVTLELALFICSRIHAFKDTVLLCRPSRDSLSSLR